MATQLTKHQHQIPQFYLKLWGDSGKKLWQYDLKHFTCDQKGTKRILQGEFYYEEDTVNPDNRIENLLGKIETECAPILEGFNDILKSYPNHFQNSNLKKELNNYLSPAHQETIKKFAAFQYLRIPGAIEQKEYELQGSTLQKDKIDYGLNPGRFVENGFEHLKKQFMSLILMLNYSFDETFLTSDWPCFDLKDSENAPLLGEEIGRSSEVVACLPLGPRLSALFVPRNFNNNPQVVKSPELIIRNSQRREVKNQNILVIQQCIRYVISTKNEDFIFKVARKRKRGKL